jgi:hypothetical protein
MSPKRRNFKVTWTNSWVTISPMEPCRKSFWPHSSLAICFAALLVSGAAQGGDMSGPAASTAIETAPANSGAGGTVSPVSWETSAEVSGIARSTFEGRRDVGKVEMLDSNGTVVGSYQATPGVGLRFGLDYQRNTFGLPTGAPLPDRLQAFNLSLGADLQLGDAWLVRLEAQPGFYGEDAGLRSRDLSCPLIVGGSYFVNADLQLIAGISYDPNRNFVVLPGVGLRWKFATDWVLNGVPPTPRIEYSMTKSLTLYAGADLRSASYRASGDFGRLHGMPELDNAVVDYTEIRVGAGATWKINSVVTMQIESGCVLVDQFDFHRDDVRFRSTETPPYGGISLKAAF